MRIKIKNLSELLNNEISLEERGLLITIVLLKDADPKLTLAKVKAKINMKEARNHLIKLHEEGFVDWSGYKQAKKSIGLKSINPAVIEVVDFMNDLCGTRFNHNSKSTTTNLANRLAQHSVDDVKLVVANRYSEWKDDALMSKYLTPQTIFRPSKFDKYLEEALRTKSGESLLNAVKIDLKKGDEITYDISQQFSKEDIYIIRVFSLEDGKKIGSGIIAKKYGKDIQRVLKIRQNNIDRGASPDANYYYEGK